jgi:hypothetical protein
MEWRRRHAWQLLLGMTALIAVVGLNPVKQGIHEDPSVPLAFTGMTADELESDNPQSFRLIDVRCLARASTSVASDQGGGHA